MSKSKDQSSEIQILLYGLENELHGLIKREHAEIRDELTQMGSVVGDAIKTLMHSLNSLSTYLDEQDELVQRIAATAEGKESNRQKEYQELSKQVKHNIAAVVRSFQFEDIVQQLVKHCRTRSDGLEQLIDKLNQNFHKMKDVDESESEQVLMEMLADIASVRKALEKENPVKQSSMNTGGIELF